MRRRGLNLSQLGWALAVPVIFLSLVGLAAIHATDRDADDIARQNAQAVARGEKVSLWRQLQAQVGPQTLRQAALLVSGVAMMFPVLIVGYRRIGRYSVAIYWITIVMLALLVIDRYVIDIPFVPVRRATRRWIEFAGIGLQPSELMKLALVLMLAHYLRFRDSYRTWLGLIPPFLLTILPMVLILKQPDLGTLLMLLPVLFAMLFVAGARLRHLGLIVALGLATLPAFYVYGMEDYQKDRVRVMLRQNSSDDEWHRREGYQLRQGLIALGTGGVFGEGWREGVFVRYNLLPEEHNDFIFAIVGNQWGLVGCALVMLAYVIIIICGLEVAVVTNDPYGRLLAVGVVVMIVAQALLNMAMNVGCAPITGMTLPFVSYGGSSLWVNFIALGLLLSIAQRRPLLIAKRPFEHSDE